MQFFPGIKMHECQGIIDLQNHPINRIQKSSPKVASKNCFRKLLQKIASKNFALAETALVETTLCGD
jgi:hypothetical protein